MKRSFTFIGLALVSVCLFLLAGLRTASHLPSKALGQLYVPPVQSAPVNSEVLAVARLAEAIAIAVSPTIQVAFSEPVRPGSVTIAGSPTIVVTFSERVDPAADVDLFAFTAQAPERISFGATAIDLSAHSAEASVARRFDVHAVVIKDYWGPLLSQGLEPAAAGAQSAFSDALGETDVSVSVPAVMKVGESGTLVLRLDKRQLRQFGLSPPQPMVKSIRVGDHASVRLVADRRDFDVGEPPPPQYVWEDESTEFYFVVTPLRVGSRNLKLFLGVRVRLIDGDAVREKLVADQHIEVRHNPPYEVKELAPVWMPVLVVLASALGAAMVFVRRRYDRIRGRGGRPGF